MKTRYLPNGDGRRENGDVGIKMNGTGQNMYNEIPNPMSTVMEDTGLSAEHVTWVDSRPIKGEKWWELGIVLRLKMQSMVMVAVTQNRCKAYKPSMLK